MLYPTIHDLTQGKFNRYELAIATAKCARLVTDEYVRQREAAEKQITGNKETDKPLTAMIDKEYRDEKAVKVAINHIYKGDFLLLHADEVAAEEAAREAAEAAKAADESVEAAAEDTPVEDAAAE
jgi:DNA-directed RNA polymerase subunit K/omega